MRVLGQPLIDREGLRVALSEKLGDRKRLVRSQPTHGQRVLRAVLDGPIRIGTVAPAAVR